MDFPMSSANDVGIHVIGPSIIEYKCMFPTPIGNGGSECYKTAILDQSGKWMLIPNKWGTNLDTKPPQS